MQIPVDVKAVIDEAMNIDEASQTPIDVAVYVDETAPGDIQALVRQAFASTSSHARVSTVYFPNTPATTPNSADIAVIVAGLNEKVGRYASDIRAAGIPVMVVTTLPDLVCEISQKSGYPVLKGDLLSPPVSKEEKALPQTAGQGEPHALTEESGEKLRTRMGQWVIETCKDKRLAFALAFPFVRKPLSLEAVNATSAQNAGIGLVVIIPGADMPIMTLNQAKMLLQIAAAYGQPMSIDRVKELAAVVGGAFAARAVARQLVAFVPGLGWAIKAAIGYAGTCAMGHAAIEYFEGGGSVKHFVEVIAEARDKAVMAAESVKSQPSVKAAAKKVGAKVSAAANSAAEKVVPAAASVVESAVGAANDAGAIPESAFKAANLVTDTVSRRFKRDK